VHVGVGQMPDLQLPNKPRRQPGRVRPALPLGLSPDGGKAPR